MTSPHEIERVRLIRERQILLTLMSIIEAEYLPTDLSDSPKQTVQCEDLPMSQALIPAENWHAMVAKLDRMARSREADISKYTITDRRLFEHEQEEETSPIIEPQEGSQPSGPQAKAKASGGNGRAKGNGGGRPGRGVQSAKAG